MRRSLAAKQKRLLDKNPDDLAQRGQVVAALRLLSDGARDSGELEQSEVYARRAWELGQPILAAGPRAKNFSSTINVALTFAQNRGAASEGPTLGDPAAALPWLDRVHELTARYAALPRAAQPDPELPAMVLRHELMIRADVFQQLHREAEARSTYEQVLQVSAPLANGSMVARIGYMVTHDTYACFLLEIHEPQRAFEIAPPATPPTALEQQGADRQQLIQVADLLALHARIDLQRNHHAEAQREIAAFVALFEELYRKDRSDSQAAVQMETSFFDVGRERALDFPTRRRLLERGLAVLAPPLAAAPTSFEYLMADAQGRLRLAEACAANRSCPARDDLLNRAASDLNSVLTLYHNSTEAHRMLARVNQVRART